MVLAAVLLETKAVAAQHLSSTPTSTTSALTINGLTCPDNIVVVNQSVDLSVAEYSTSNTTYVLAPGMYNITSTILVDAPEGLCYVAQGQGVTVQVLGDVVFSAQGGPLGLKGFLLQSADSLRGCVAVQSFAAEDMVMQGFYDWELYCYKRCNLRNCRVLNNNNVVAPLFCGTNADVLLEQVRIQATHTIRVSHCAFIAAARHLHVNVWGQVVCSHIGSFQTTLQRAGFRQFLLACECVRRHQVLQQP